MNGNSCFANNAILIVTQPSEYDMDANPLPGQVEVTPLPSLEKAVDPRFKRLVEAAEFIRQNVDRVKGGPLCQFERWLRSFFRDDGSKDNAAMQRLVRRLDFLCEALKNVDDRSGDVADYEAEFKGILKSFREDVASLQLDKKHDISTLADNTLAFEDLYKGRLSMAFHLKKHEAFHKALELLEQAIADPQFDRLKDKDKARAFRVAAEAAAKLNDDEKASKYYAKAIEFLHCLSEEEQVHILRYAGNAALRLSDEIKAVNLWIRAANLAMNSGDDEQALVLYGKVIRSPQFQQLGDRDRAFVWRDAAEAAVRIKNDGQANSYYQEVMDLSSSLLPDEKSRIFHYAGNTASRLGNKKHHGSSVAEKNRWDRLALNRYQQALMHTVNERERLKLQRYVQDIQGR